MTFQWFWSSLVCLVWILVSLFQLDCFCWISWLWSIMTGLNLLWLLSISKNLIVAKYKKIPSTYCYSGYFLGISELRSHPRLRLDFIEPSKYFSVTFWVIIQFLGVSCFPLLQDCLAFGQLQHVEFILLNGSMNRSMWEYISASTQRE